MQIDTKKRRLRKEKEKVHDICILISKDGVQFFFF